MFLNLVQIYGINIGKDSKIPESYKLRECIVNSEHIIEIKEDFILAGLYKSKPKLFPVGLSPNVKFAILFLSNNRTVSVIAETQEILKKLTNNKIILNG